MMLKSENAFLIITKDPPPLKNVFVGASILYIYMCAYHLHRVHIYVMLKNVCVGGIILYIYVCIHLHFVHI